MSPILSRSTEPPDDVDSGLSVEAGEQTYKDSSGPRIFMIAGDPSGDIHAGNLVKSLLKLRPDCRIAGLGGPNMQKAGVSVLSNIVDELAIIGIVGVIQNFPRLKRLYTRTVNFIAAHKPDAVILIDYPGFNLRIAAEAKAMGLRVIYYISPQVWAWKKGRIKAMARDIDEIIVIFPFEEQLFKQAGMNVSYVGHPLLDIINIDMDRDAVCREFNLDPAKRIVGLVPGSRRSEIEGMLPPMLKAAERLAEAVPDVQFALPRASTIPQEVIFKHLEKCSVPVAVADRYRYNLRASFDFAWVTSGTATLETALLLTPMIITYRVNWPTWLIGKSFMNLACIGLPNIVAGDLIVPELLQDEFTPQNLYLQTREFLTNADLIEEMRESLRLVKEKLGGPGASKLAAEAVDRALDRPPKPATA